MVDFVVVRFVTADDPISKAIRFKTDSDVSHAEFVMPDGWMVGAHLDGGIQRRPADYEKVTVDHRVKLDRSNADEIYNSVLASVGTPYDWKAILGFLVAQPLSESGHLICSGFVAKVLLDFNVLFPIPKPVEQVDPDYLLGLLSQIGELHL